MRKVGRFEIHPGNRPGERRVYSRSTKGNLRRVGRKMEQTILLKHDLRKTKNIGINYMKATIKVHRKKFIFFAVAAVVLIVALTVNFPLS